MPTLIINFDRVNNYLLNNGLAPLSDDAEATVIALRAKIDAHKDLPAPSKEQKEAIKVVKAEALGITKFWQLEVKYYRLNKIAQAMIKDVEAHSVSKKQGEGMSESLQGIVDDFDVAQGAPNCRRIKPSDDHRYEE